MRNDQWTRGGSAGIGELDCLSFTIVVLAAVIGSSACSDVYLTDVSPESANGAPGTGIGTSGIIRAVAGDDKALYAVSQNAGVWKSESGGPWSQLADSPERAYSIAVDPNDPSHIVVGERDAEVSVRGCSGLWESRDAGQRWVCTFDPSTRIAGCRSRAIPSIAFSRQSTVVAGTTCGIVVKGASDQDFNIGASPPGIGPITAVAASHTKLWARTATLLLFANDANPSTGLSWSQVKFPPQDASGNPIQFSRRRGDLYSLGAFDTDALVIYPVWRPDSQNYTTLLRFSVQTGTFSSQRIIDAMTGDTMLDGTGAGGRRLVKSYNFGKGDITTLGGMLQLYVSNGQDVYGLFSQDGITGEYLFRKIASTPCGGCTAPKDRLYKNLVHPDILDFHSSPLSVSWVAGDGGIARNDLSGRGWTSLNYRLHTLHAHSVALMPGAQDQVRVMFATHDNNAWFQEAPLGQAGSWRQVPAGCMGDANWVAADAGSGHFALAVRHAQCAGLIDFEAAPIAYTQAKLTNIQDGTQSPLALHVVQTPADETAPPELDVVMMVLPPLQSKDGTGMLVPVPGPLGQPRTGSVIIRTTTFASQPNIDASQLRSWVIASEDFTFGPMLGFWVSGGHNAPVLYAYATDPAVGVRGIRLFRRSPGEGWSLLPLTNILPGGVNGPAFVNPYNPNNLYVLTSAGVQVSTDGGQQFTVENELTDLVTRGGVYAMRNTFTGFNGNNAVADYAISRMGNISSIAFSREDPAQLVVATPYSGLFYRNSHLEWIDLTSLLPKPATPISGVAFSSRAIYVATEGRGLLAIMNYSDAKKTR
jgi:hypothetical protein